MLLLFEKYQNIKNLNQIAVDLKFAIVINEYSNAVMYFLQEHYVHAYEVQIRNVQQYKYTDDVLI
jgi:hypothetical protein